MTGSCNHGNENKCLKKEAHFLTRQTTTTFCRNLAVPLARFSTHFQLPPIFQFTNSPHKQSSNQ
jgi:hypothetical protein